MNKIPTLFQRDENHKVIDKLTPGCEWVLAGEGVATEKLDGTNVRLTIRCGEVVRVEKRRNPTRSEKSTGILDPWYIDCSDSHPCDQWIRESVKHTETYDWPDGEHPCEALGPKIGTNRLGLTSHVCIPFLLFLDLLTIFDAPRTFQPLREFEFPSRYFDRPGSEGLVFHHPDGRMAKIKRKDF